MRPAVCKPQSTVFQLLLSPWAHSWHDNLDLENTHQYYLLDTKELKEKPNGVAFFKLLYSIND